MDRVGITFEKLNNNNYLVNSKGRLIGNIVFSGMLYSVSNSSGDKILTNKYNNNINNALDIAAYTLCDYYNKHKDVIWFNTWFSAIANTIKCIKDEFDTAHIIGTNKNEDCTYKGIVDEFYVEPSGVSGEEYLDFALDFCTRHKVKIFFPKYHMNTISKNKNLFENIGVTVVCEDYSLITAFNSKDEIYKILLSRGYERIPEYGVANSLIEFKQLYNRYSKEGHLVCTKFDKDEGASSFRLINNNILSYDSLNEPLENMLTYNSMCNILEDGEKRGLFKPLIVMPKLLSPEVSIDCYNSKQLGLIVIPRYKLGNRVKEIKLTQELIEDVKYLQEVFGFKSIFNVQYRWDKNGKAKLLEINTRMSGGIHLSSMSGVSIPNQVVAEILGVNSNQSIDDIKEYRLTQCENPILL